MEKATKPGRAGDLAVRAMHDARPAATSSKERRILPLRVTGAVLAFFGALMKRTRRLRFEKQQGPSPGLGAEELLQQTLQPFQDIIDRSPNIIFVKDREGRFLLANRTLERCMGVERGGWRGKTDFDFLPPERAEYYCKDDRRVLGEGVSIQVEETVRLYDGSERVFLANKFPLVDHDGRAYAVCGISTDITDRKRMEDELRRMRQQLEDAKQTLEKSVQARTVELQETIESLHRFSHALVHDMRAPLRAMHSFATLMQKDCASCELARNVDFLRLIKASAERMDSLVRDALRYVRILQQELPFERVDPGLLLGRMIHSDPNLRSPAADVRLEGVFPPVIANKEALTQCFSSLLSNAVKFVSEGTRPQVRIRAESCGAYCRVWVEDNGIGIAPEHQVHIFDMFHQLDAHHHEGTGIGLAIVRKAVERMGGRAGVESEPGNGSRFWVELRAAEPGDHQ